MRQTALINRISDEMRAFFPEARTVLFGSQARGTADSESDIDLLVLLPDTYSGRDFVRRRSEIVDRLYDMEIAEGVAISPVVLTDSVWENRRSMFAINVRRDGMTI